MKNEIQIFNNPQFGEIRTAGTPDEPIFCLTDLCKILSLDSSAVMRRLDGGVITSHPITDSLGRVQQANFVNEDGLYDVILDSRKPEAKAFRKWVTSEVLPSIRKTGSYSIEKLSRKELAMMIIQAEEEKERLAIENKQQAEKIEQDAPLVTFATAIVGSTTSCLIGELAKILRQNGIETGERRLFEWMRNKGYLGKHGERYNIPNQEYIERGYFELKKGTRSGNGGVMHTTITPKVTPKGQQYFINKFLKGC